MFRRLFRRKRVAGIAGGAAGVPTSAGLMALNLEETRSETPSWSEQFPDVPRPETNLTPQMFVARFICHDIYGEETPALAANLLELGYDSPSLRRLAGETQIRCQADAVPLMNQVMREFGMPVPLPVCEARMLVTRQIARQVIAGNRDVWRAVSDIEMIWDWDADDADIRSVLHQADDDIWDSELQRFRPSLSRVLERFARIAKGSQ